MAFVQALRAWDYEPIRCPATRRPRSSTSRSSTPPGAGPPPGDVLLVSHDGDFLADIEALLDTDRRVGVVAFTEFRNAGFTALESRGVQTFDLEYAVGAFNTRLPRLRVIPIEEFDPAAYL